MIRLNRFKRKLGLLLNKLKKLFLSYEKTGVIFFLLLYFLILFFPALRHSKFWSDDWALYWDTRSNGNEIMNATVSNGRPILGWLLRSAYSTSFLSNHLIILQLLSIAGIFLLGISIYSRMRASQFSFLASLILVLGVGLLPGFQEYVYFISCFAYSWACFFGFLSCSLLNSDRVIIKFLGVSLLTLAFLIYPVGAIFYFLSLYIEYLESVNESIPIVRYLKGIQKKIYGFLVSLILSLLIALLISRILDIRAATRVHLVDTFALALAKIEWILTRLFVSEFRIFSTVSPTPTQAALEFCLIFIPISIALLAPLRELNSKKFFQYCLIITFPLFGSLPNLIISENQFEYRTLTAFYAMALLMWIFSVTRILNLAMNRKPEGLSQPVRFRNLTILSVSSLIAVQFGQTQADSNRLWISPSTTRDVITNSVIDRVGILPPSNVCLVIPIDLYSQIPRMGIYSMKSDLVSGWVPDPYIRISLEKRSIIFRGKVEVVKSALGCPVNYLIFDYSELAN